MQMLVLTRRKGDFIKIGDDIMIKVTGMEGNNVRLGIETPAHVGVFRGEIYEAVKCSNLNAVLSTQNYKKKENRSTTQR